MKTLPKATQELGQEVEENLRVGISSKFDIPTQKTPCMAKPGRMFP